MEAGHAACKVMVVDDEAPTLLAEPWDELPTLAPELGEEAPTLAAEISTEAPTLVAEPWDGNNYADSIETLAMPGMTSGFAACASEDTLDAAQVMLGLPSTVGAQPRLSASCDDTLEAPTFNGIMDPWAPTPPDAFDTLPMLGNACMQMGGSDDFGNNDSAPTQAYPTSDAIAHIGVADAAERPASSSFPPSQIYTETKPSNGAAATVQVGIKKSFSMEAPVDVSNRSKTDIVFDDCDGASGTTQGSTLVLDDMCCTQMYVPDFDAWGGATGTTAPLFGADEDVHRNQDSFLPQTQAYVPPGSEFPCTQPEPPISTCRDVPSGLPDLLGTQPEPPISVCMEVTSCFVDVVSTQPEPPCQYVPPGLSDFACTQPEPPVQNSATIAACNQPAMQDTLQRSMATKMGTLAQDLMQHSAVTNVGMLATVQDSLQEIAQTSTIIPNPTRGKVPTVEVSECTRAHLSEAANRSAIRRTRLNGKQGPPAWAKALDKNQVTSKFPVTQKPRKGKTDKSSGSLPATLAPSQIDSRVPKRPRDKVEVEFTQLPTPLSARRRVSTSSKQKLQTERKPQRRQDDQQERGDSISEKCASTIDVSEDPPEFGRLVRISGDGWGGPPQDPSTPFSYGMVTESDNMTFTVVDVQSWNENYVLRAHCEVGSELFGKVPPRTWASQVVGQDVIDKAMRSSGFSSQRHDLD